MSVVSSFNQNKLNQSFSGDWKLCDITLTPIQLKIFAWKCARKFLTSIYAWNLIKNALFSLSQADISIDFRLIPCCCATVLYSCYGCKPSSSNHTFYLDAEIATVAKEEEKKMKVSKVKIKLRRCVTVEADKVELDREWLWHKGEYNSRSCWRSSFTYRRDLFATFWEWLRWAPLVD